ncbi:MAG: hypothetical protein NTV82_08265 [Candidatus Aminicenantes bacterium]|nr:hypothetical protein [Candidatus Aminicenantes bacterium]
MNENDTGKPLLDMPEKVRLIIQRETEDGLRRFRAGNFDSPLQAAGRIRPERTKFAPGLFRRAWIPVFGLAVGAIVIISAVLWFTRTKPQLPAANLAIFDAALSDLPGFRTLSLSHQTETAANEDLSPATAAMSTALTFATRSAAAWQETSAPPAGKLVPRYTLEQKMKILFDDKTIEQALSLFKDKFKEV